MRGKGLLIGADLDVPAVDVVNAGYRHGLLLVNAGPNTLRLIPPLVITREEIDLLIERLSSCGVGRTLERYVVTNVSTCKRGKRTDGDHDPTGHRGRHRGHPRHCERLRRAEPDAAAHR